MKGSRIVSIPGYFRAKPRLAAALTTAAFLHRVDPPPRSIFTSAAAASIGAFKPPPANRVSLPLTERRIYLEPPPL